MAEEYNSAEPLESPSPRTVARLIEAWFAQHQRPLPWRGAYDPYHVWVSEVMLQQTRMEVVLPYFRRFLERFPTIRRLAEASADEVTAAWSGLGYYRRARMLRDGAIDVMARFDGVIPRTTAELMTIPGIGRYTAGAIASIAFEERAPIVDGNVARVVARVFGTEEDAWPLAEQLVNGCTSPRALNQGLMELGALICVPRKPSCLICVLRKPCATRGDQLPRPKEKPATRALQIPLYLIADRKGRLLMRRESGALMNAMVHLPHGNTSLLPAPPLDVTTHDLLGAFRHTITNRRIEFSVYLATARTRVRPSREWLWIDAETLHEHPHPSYVKKAMRLWSAYNQ
jgi:A/G-specific adenine glycosylase